MSEAVEEIAARWPEVCVSDISELIRGVTYSKEHVTDKAKDGYTPVLRATNIQDSRLVLDSDLVFVHASNVSKNQRLRAGDIVLATSSGSKHLVGKSGLVNSDWPGSFGAFCAAIRPTEKIEPRFLAAFLQSPSYWKQVGKKALGVNINNLRRGDIESLTLPLPPMAKQREIVAEIDKQFSRLDEAVANLQRVKANLKRYKASVLKAAVEGRLVETEASIAQREGRSYETGEQLLQRILEERQVKWSGKGKYKKPVISTATSLPELPEGWTMATYSQLGEVTTGFTPPTGDAANFGGDTPFLKPTDLDAGDSVRVAREYLSSVGLQKGRKLPAGSVLVTCIGATIGKTGLALVDCATNQQINSVTPVVACVDSRYLFWWACSPSGQAQIVDNASATTLPILNKSKFEALPVALPPFAEQTRIVAEVDRHFSIIREVESEVDANLQRSQPLRQSALTNAFSTCRTGVA